MTELVNDSTGDGGGELVGSSGTGVERRGAAGWGDGRDASERGIAMAGQLYDFKGKEGAITFIRKLMWSW